MVLGSGGAWQRWCLAAVVLSSGGASLQRAAGFRRETIPGNNPFLLHVAVHVLQGVRAKVPFPQFPLNYG